MSFPNDHLIKHRIIIYQQVVLFLQFYLLSHKYSPAMTTACSVGYNLHSLQKMSQKESLAARSTAQ